MKKQKIAIIAIAAGLAVSATTSQAALSLSFSNQGLNTGIQFNGASSSFQLDPSPGSLGSPQFAVTSETGGSSSIGLVGWINGSPWTIGSITTSGTIQSAAVTGLGNLFISDGLGNDLTGTVGWMTIQTDQSAGFINSALDLNITGLAYSGANADLLALVNGGSGSMNLTFQFDPGETLAQLTTGSDQIGSYSGAFAATSVPEPSTVVAGALLLIPFGISTARILRKHKQTTV
ncbi:MAG TPA: hypothetical protein VIK35_01020 [Verrucomicrobiae bacterium]